MVFYKGLFKEKVRVGAIYRRVSDEYLDPMDIQIRYSTCLVLLSLRENENIQLLVRI